VRGPWCQANRKIAPTAISVMAAPVLITRRPPAGTRSSCGPRGAFSGSSGRAGG
jgi:hypothetical protein